MTALLAPGLTEAGADLALARAVAELRTHAEHLAALTAFADATGPCPTIARFEHLGSFVGSERHRAAIGSWLRCHHLSSSSVQDLLDHGLPGDIRCAASVARATWAMLLARLETLAAREV